LAISISCENFGSHLGRNSNFTRPAIGTLYTYKTCNVEYRWKIYTTVSGNINIFEKKL
jgi:hypothetical protein